MTTLATVPPAEQLPLVERRGLDFPFYRGVPLRPTPAQWALLLLAVAAGFMALTIASSEAPSPAERLLRSIAFLGLPLLALRIVHPGAIGALFRMPHLGDVKVILLCLVLGLSVDLCVGLLVSSIFGASANPASDGLSTQTGSEIAAFFGSTLVQLPGEELLALIPFLAILALAHNRLGLSRNAAALVAWVVSSLIFGAAHLPTYDWNWAQCLIVIGIGRLPLTLAYVMTKNVTVSSITHICYDWLLFGSSIVLTPLATP